MTDTLVHDHSDTDSNRELDFDVVVIGGGPGGSTMASYLAKAGISVAVFESSTFPRDHVGESLVPATTPVLLETGAMEYVDAAGFPKKYGAAWTSAQQDAIDHNGFTGLDHDFRAAEVLFSERDQAGVDRDHTFHVDRSKFDLILLQHAERLGAKVFSGVRVNSVDLSDPARPPVETLMGTKRVPVTARLIVDASGRRTFLGGQLSLKEPDPVFDQYALHTWFDGFDRKALAPNKEQADYIFIHFLPLQDTWVWQIPITDTTTSVGVVTQKANFQKSKADREAFFWECVDSRPELAEALRDSEQLRPLKSEGDYSYAMSQICGDGWLMVGDAARFVDPIFSSGVSVALNSARIAANDVIAAFESDGDDNTATMTKDRFGTYEGKLRRGVKNWYEFISIYYRLNILFTAFVQDPRYRLDVLKMLQGDVYDEDPPVLEAMREVVRSVEENPDHLWHDHLGTLRAPAAAPAF